MTCSTLPMQKQHQPIAEKDRVCWEKTQTKITSTTATRIRFKLLSFTLHTVLDARVGGCEDEAAAENRPISHPTQHIS